MVGVGTQGIAARLSNTLEFLSFHSIQHTSTTKESKGFLESTARRLRDVVHQSAKLNSKVLGANDCRPKAVTIPQVVCETTLCSSTPIVQSKPNEEFAFWWRLGLLQQLGRRYFRLADEVCHVC
ncbi:hypothetical protein PVAP13_5KG094500 [Panicum virgatum]|uniref:Uncharacterized protein n=1 Tax=Panicum virgatum TaxID=38727 RepID=A0A8T0SFG6_PANVG|nr:hypothetical protein PVAP13_5KG094500 [Panicum virgatum]